MKILRETSHALNMKLLRMKMKNLQRKSMALNLLGQVCSL